MRFRGDIGPDFVTISPNNLERTKQEFLHVKASSGSRQLGRGAPSRRARRPSAARPHLAGLPPGVIDDKTGGENHRRAGRDAPELPAVLPAGAARAAGGYTTDGSPRVYDIYDSHHRRYRAYRIVLNAGFDGQYYGIQGMTWKSPPILDDSSDTMRMARPQVQAVLRWQPPAPGVLEHAARRLLGVEHPLEDLDQRPDARYRAVAEPLRRQVVRRNSEDGPRAWRGGCTSASCSRA